MLGANVIKFTQKIVSGRVVNTKYFLDVRLLNETIAQHLYIVLTFFDAFAPIDII
jgi:hypothetical protein